ncbi:MAG: 2,3-bisphosphoglycerate-independent phosphoglycerate mutase [Myxococcota bacterium]|nr:2,3-bisphosphoglycerate-independent phosphoglycerate mutase [Myxococcota bacterium]
MPNAVQPLILVVLDGWGERADAADNAITRAKTPTFDMLRLEYPHATLSASGLDVGLPGGQMGNSEVGHVNLGAGRIVYQDLTRIDKAVNEGEFHRNPVLHQVFERVIGNNSRLHLIGLCSDGKVHSSLDHLYALNQAASAAGVTRVFLHAMLDGRDTPPKSAAGYLKQIQTRFARQMSGRIATIGGRYFGMDRDKRWDRVKKHYDAMVHGEGLTAFSPMDALKAAYERGETDEFVTPTVVMAEHAPVAKIEDGDGVILFNFRADRMRQLSRALSQRDFDGFYRGKTPNLAMLAAMTRYDENLDLPTVFPPQDVSGSMGEIIAAAGLRQFRTAETEKYAHVTFFFNGGQEKVFPGEDRRLVESPREVATYDLKPSMSAVEVANGLVEAIRSKNYAFMLVNFANGDMVGHTGVFEAARQAAETVDQCLARVLKAADETGAIVMITADHGNAEQMLDPSTGEPHTAHTTNRVPLYLYGQQVKNLKLRDGVLADVAPTALRLMGLQPSPAMDGKVLVSGPGIS